MRRITTFAMIGLLLACRVHPWQGFSKAIDPDLVWPSSPEEARIAYVTAIRQQQDLFKTAGFWRGLKEIVGGHADSRLIRPFALAMHPDGGLLVTDPGKGIVHFYCWGRRQYVAVGPKLQGGLQSPVGVGVLPDGRILISDSRLGVVECFDAKGRPLGPFCGAELLERPAGIAVNNSLAEVYIADVTAHRIAVFDLQGNLIRFIGNRGDGSGEFNFPTHLALDSQEHLYVTDSMNFRVQVLNLDGTFVRSIGSLGNAPGRFSKPKGVAVDAKDRVIVVEGLYDALQFFSPKGELLLSLGSPGSQPGEFWLPNGVLVDTTEQLVFVADSYNSRVEVFQILGE